MSTLIYNSLNFLGLGGNNLNLSWETFAKEGPVNLETKTISFFGIPLPFSLSRLYLHDSGLEGPIPDWIGGGKHHNLIVLWLQNNRLTGSIPSNFNTLTLLEDLRLHDNELTGELPDLSGLTGPPQLDLTGLTQLGLGGNNLDLSWATFESGGKLPLENITRLTHLYLHDSGLVGAIPSWLGNHAGLQVLWLHGNNLAGGAWAALKRVTALRALTMSLNAVSGNGLLVWFDGRPNFLSVPAGALPADSDAIKSRVTWTAVTVDPAAVHVPPHPHIARVADPIEESAVDIAFLYRDGDDEPVDGALKLPAVVCLPVSSTHAEKELRLLRHDGSSWRYLETADVPSGYDPGTGMVAVCGTTSGFSRFVPAVVDLASGATAAGRVGFIKRLEPSIRGVTVSSGDFVRLSFDIWGRQDILENDLGEGLVFAWDDGSASGSFRPSVRSNEIIYTAPDAPGKYTVTVAPPAGSCVGGENSDERCAAEFTITVRRPSAVPVERPAPKNPVGAIPSVLADAEGRQYEVFTPEEGGYFDGGDVTVSAEAGVVPNLEIVGVRADVAGSSSNVGMTTQRYTLVGDRYDVLAVDASETAISSYVLNAPLEVCVPLPPEARHDVSDIALVVDNPDGTLTVLSAKVRITQADINVCGNLGVLPATIVVGTAGSPEAIPTATPDPDEIAYPDTGGAAPSGIGVLLVMIFGSAVVLGGALLVRRRRLSPSS